MFNRFAGRCGQLVLFVTGAAKRLFVPVRRRELLGDDVRPTCPRALIERVRRSSNFRARRAALSATVALLSAGCTDVLLVNYHVPKPDIPYVKAILNGSIFFAGLTTGGLTRVQRVGPAAAAPVLSAFTPTASFLGNQTGLVGAALNPPSALAGALLVRESNCSLTQYSFTDTPDGATPTLTTSPGFDAYVHKISSLATTAGAFPKGCADRRLGTPSAPGAYLGRASNGDLLGVSVNADGQITLLRLNVQGKLLSTTALGPPGSADTVAAADLNGDGIADIVSPFITSGGVSGIGVFLSRPDGTYGPVTVYPGYPGDAQRVARVSIEDINGDGKADIVAVVAPGSLIGDSTVVTLLGAGDGTFKPGTSTAKTPSNFPFVIADFDGDGKKDLLTADGYLSPGNGDGSFGAAVLRLSDTQRGKNITVGDFNGDGKLDLAVVGFGKAPFLSILAGNGDGTFTTKAVYAGIRGADFVNVTDIDGDGNLDIVVGLAGPGAYGPDVGTFTVMQFLLGNGDGTFAGAPAIPASGVLGPAFAVADFNGDGFPDLAVLNVSGSASFTLYPGSASGRYTSANAPIALPIQPRVIAAGDLNGDGKVDLVAAGRDQLVVLPGRGDGSFGAPQTYAVPAVAGQIRNMVLADVNGDGRADVVVTMEGQSAATGGLFVYIAKTDGTLSAPVQIDPATNLIALAAADLDGDGRADIVVGGADPQFYTSGKVLNGVRIYRSNADGSFTSSATLQTPNAVSYGAVAIGDMNKDGKADLVFSARDAALNDSIYIALGNGDASFGVPASFPHGDGPGVRALAVGDFNGDGNPDLIVAGDSYAEILVGKGDGTLTGSVALTIAGNGSAVVVADLNGDGKTDAVMATTSGIVPLLRTKSVIDSAPPGTADFTVSAAPATQTVNAGQPASTTVTVTPGNGFKDTVALSCAGLPAGASCSFAPASLVVNGSAIISTVTISTAAKAAAVAGPVDGRGPGTGTTSAILAAGALLLALGWSLQCSGSGRTRPAWRAAGRAGVLGTASLLYACGGGDGGSNGSGQIDPPPPAGGTPPGTYMVAINVAGASVSHALSFVLVVK